MSVPTTDITNPGATHDTGAANHVRAGMELLTWQYPPSDWRRHLDARARRKWLASLAKHPPRARPFPTAAVSVGGVFAAGFAAAIIADSAIAIGATALGLLGTVVTHFATRQRSLPADVVGRPAVLFTSTGVIFGEYARRWHGHRYRLNEVRVRYGELTGLEPAYLELEFSSGWRETTLSIPVPSHLERDAVELTGKLEDMMLGRALGPAGSTALTREWGPVPPTGDDLKRRG